VGSITGYLLLINNRHVEFLSEETRLWQRRNLSEQSRMSM